jgi:hypothetical protein
MYPFAQTRAGIAAARANNSLYTAAGHAVNP